MKTGRTVVYLYDGVIPKSGKALVEFAGHKLVHRSIAKDKSDLLVHISSGIIIRAYPAKTNRSVILNDLAENIERLDHFLDNREQYEIQDRPKLLKVKDNDADVKYACSMTHYSDGSCVKPSQFKQEYKLPLKKSYNVGESKWD